MACTLRDAIDPGGMTQGNIWDNLKDPGSALKDQLTGEGDKWAAREAAKKTQSQLLAESAGQAGIDPALYKALHSTDPKKPSIFDTSFEALQTMYSLGPLQFEAEKAFAGKYQDLYGGLYRQSLLGPNGMISTLEESSPRMQALQNQMNAQQLQGNLQNLQTLGSGAVQAFQQANPEIAKLQQAMSQQALQGAGTPQNLTNDQMQAFAQNRLALGGQLDPQTEQNIINATLSGFNTMGRAQDPTAIARTALNLSDAVQQRQDQAFGFANAAASSQATMEELKQRAQGQTSSMLGGAYQAQMGTTLPALQTVLEPSQALTQAGQAYGMGAATPTQAQGTNPYTLGMNLFEDYTSLAQSEEMAKANQKGALMGGGLSAAGGIAGAAILAL